MMIRASTFSDCRVEAENSEGSLKSRIDSYFVCLAKQNEEDCLRVTPSKDWDTRGVAKVDAHVWDCACGANYKASWGQIVVVTRVSAVDGHLERFYIRTEAPPGSVEDVRAMHLEDTNDK